MLKLLRKILPQNISLLFRSKYQQKKILFLLLFLSSNCIVEAQEKPTIKEFTIVGEDTLIISKVPEVEILAFKDYDEKLRYFILKRKVLKVYPYAQKAKAKLTAIQIGLDSIPKEDIKNVTPKKLLVG